jgi:hypothetical protein
LLNYRNEMNEKKRAEDTGFSWDAERNIQLTRARQEIASFAAERYPFGKCDECGFALDKDGNCTRGDYMYDEE